MDFDDLLITTGVDSLIKLIKEKERIEIPEAAQVLKLPVETIREWAQILEEQKIILVEYKLAKAYLKWIKPSQDQVEQEIISFKEQKNIISNDIGELKSKFDEEKEGLLKFKKSFKETYDSVYPKLSGLDEKYKKFEAVQSLSSQKGESAGKNISEIHSKLDDLDSMLVFTQSQLDKTKKELIEKTVTPDEVASLKGMKEEISMLNQKLSNLESKAYAAINALPKDALNYPELSKEFSNLKKMLQTFSSERGKILEIVKNSPQGKDKGDLSEIKEALLPISKNLSGFEMRFASLSRRLDDAKKLSEKINENSGNKKEITDLKEEVLSLSEEFSKMQEHFSKISSDVHSYQTMIANPKSGSMQSSQLGAMLSNLDSNYEKISQKTIEIEKSLKTLQKVSEVVSEFEEIRKEIDEKRDDLGSRATEIFQRLDEEDETYRVFQSIKEKAIISIEEYSHQLESVKKELSDLAAQTEEMQKSIKGDVGQIFSKPQDLEIAPIIEKLDNARKQKKLFDQINSSVVSLEQSLDGISKRLALLSKQAEIIELHQHNISIPKEQKAKEDDQLENELELTKSEQLQYEIKRKELMGMIKKLWEEQ